MRTRYVPPWVDGVTSSKRPVYKSLRGELSVDVVVVGGGLAGCATALSCATAGFKTVLVEANRVGQGGSGRASGLVLPDPAVPFRALAGAHGKASARKVAEVWRRTAMDAATQVRRLGLRCGLEPLDVIEIATGDREPALRREFDARAEAGLTARWLKGREGARATAFDRAAGALRMADGFALDPYRACLGLAAAAARRGVAFAEHAAVTAIRPTRAHLEVATPGATIRAQNVIVTTGTATSEFRPLQRHFKNREAYVVLTEPLSLTMRKQVLPSGLVVRDSASGRLIRRTADHRLLVSGADQPAPSARLRAQTLVQRTGQLMYEVLLMYPGISGLRPEFGWHVPYGATADGLPYIGAHRNYPRHLFALGNHTSLTGAFLAARILVRALKGTAEKTDALFGWAR